MLLRKMLFFLLLICLLLVTAADAAVAGADAAVADAANKKDVILEPINKGDDVVLIYAPGAGIDPSAYTPLMQKIQESLSNYAVWIAVPHVPLDVAAIGLKNAVHRVTQGLYDAGLSTKDEQTVFYGGHSLGGAIMPMLVNTPSDLPSSFDKPKGMILNGAFLTRSFKTEAIPDKNAGQYVFNTCPVLTIGGELDGLCRITRVAEAKYTQIDLSIDPVSNLHYFPVTVIEGMSHMQFASGEIPKLVEERDLKPEISYDDAHELVAIDVNAFITAMLTNDYTSLDSRQESSLQLLNPIIDSLLLEGYHQFKPPCYCEAVDEYGGLEYGTCEDQPGCYGGSPWSETAARIMGADGSMVEGGLKGLTITGKNSQHIVTEEDPSCHLPLIHSGTYNNIKTSNPDPSTNPGHTDEPGKDRWNQDGPPLCEDSDGCTLDITTVTQLVYSTGSEMDIWRLAFGSDSFDTGYVPISSREMKTKMKSRDSVYEASNTTVYTDSNDLFNDLDSVNSGRCGEINNAAIEKALSMVPLKTRERYESIGKKMSVGVDLDVCPAGPCWIWARLDYVDAGNEIKLQSPSFAGPNKNPFPCGEKGVDGKLLPCPAGMHYCKLVSPARVVEWIYVDSLRMEGSLQPTGKSILIKEEVKDDEKCCDVCDSSQGLQKYWSIDDIFDQCGEACMDPKSYNLYHKFEKNLLPADNTNTPCSDHGYYRYKKTTTHGFGPIKMTFDMYQNDGPK